MKRTAEKALSIISAVFTTISIILSIIGLFFWKAFTSDPVLRREAEMELLADPTLAPGDVEAIFLILDFMEGFGWFIVVVFMISLIMNIIGIVNIWNNKNPKLAGIMFIIGGLLAGILSLTSILLYIAGILCFTRKPPLTNDPTFVEQNYDGTMRPL